MRSLATALLVCCLIALPGFGQEEMPEVARSLMEEAAVARDANRTDEAIAKYTRVIEVAPTLASAYVNLGALYFNQKKVDQAYATFVKGLETSPADRTLLSNAAAAAQQLGKSADALTYIDKALEKNAKDASLHSLRGTILRSLGRNDDALIAFQQAAGLAPDDAKVQFSLGNQLYQLGRKDEAIAAYGRAVALDKTLIRAYYNLGAVLFESGRYDEALQAYKVALAPIEQSFAKGEKIDPIHARAYANLGGIYLKQQQWQPAIDAYQKSLRLDAKNQGAHYNLGFLYFTTNQTQRAEEEYHTALATDSSLPLAYLHLGIMAYRRGEYDKAAQLLRDGLPHYDSEARLSALKTLARAELARSKRTEAKDALEGALKEKGDDLEALLLLGRLQRQSEAYPQSKATLERARVLAPQNSIVTLERLLVARATGDLATERTAAEELLAREPQRAAPLNAEYNNILLRLGDITAARKAGALRGPFANAVADALDGKREPAARALAQLGTPIARGDAGLLWWQLGRPADARPQLNAAHATFADWNEVTLAEGEIALADRRYSDAIDKLSIVKCDAPQPSGVIGNSVLISMGRSDDLCARTKDALSNALVSQAANELANGSLRGARGLLERVNDERLRAVTFYLRGRAAIDEGGRESISRAVSLGLPSTLEAMAKKDLDATEPAPNEPVEPASATPHRTVVVFLPDVPAESDKKLAEAMNALVTQWGAAANVPLQVELFRRADDARSFVLSNRDKVGIVIANPDFARALEFSPRFAFTRAGSTSYRRVLVVPVKSSAKSLADLKGKTISGAEGLGDGGVAVTTPVPDDLTAVANALFGKTDAALVNEANPLLAQHTRDLREVHSTTAALPVYAFAAMPAADRTALYDAVNPKALAPLQMGVTRIMKERPKKELSPITVAALGLPRLADPPQNLALRLTVELPQVAINEDLFGKP
jgi:tetratricopeptide (TPR) repeat protein